MTDWNPKNMQTLDAWRRNLSIALEANLPLGTAVETISEDNPKEGCTDRYAVIHFAEKSVRVKLHFPESLDAVVIRVLEAIK